MARKAAGQQSKKNGGDLGFEAKLWADADALRNNMDAAEYKHVVLGLIVLKYIAPATKGGSQIVRKIRQHALPSDVLMVIRNAVFEFAASRLSNRSSSDS